MQNSGEAPGGDPPKQGKSLFFLGPVPCGTGPVPGAILGRGPHIRKHPSIHELPPPRVPVRENFTVGLQGANMGGYCHLVANLPHSISNLG